MAKKYYAVRKGKVTGIFLTWEECRDSVHGFPGAEYKSFPDSEQAEAYLMGWTGEKKAGVQETGHGGDIAAQIAAAQTVSGKNVSRAGTAEEQTPRPQAAEGELIAYVDGSYHAETAEFSYGAVLLLPQGDVCLSEKFSDPELSQMRNVAGEIKGSEAAMRYAVQNGYRKVVIHHDYEGVAKWCLGQWKTNKEGTRAYKAFYDSLRDRLSVEFVKVKGHSGDTYNDMADKLAKEALGIS